MSRNLSLTDRLIFPWNGTIQHVDIGEEGLRLTTNRQWLKEYIGLRMMHYSPRLGQAEPCLECEMFACLLWQSLLFVLQV